MNILNEYLSILQENPNDIIVLTEDVKSNIIDLKLASDSNDHKKILSIVSKAPKMSISKIESFGKESSKDFDKCFNLAKKQLRVKLPNKLVDPIALGITLSSIHSDDPFESIKKKSDKIINKKVDWSVVGWTVGKVAFMTLLIGLLIPFVVMALQTPLNKELPTVDPDSKYYKLISLIKTAQEYGKTATGLVLKYKWFIALGYALLALIGIVYEVMSSMKEEK